MKFETRTEEDGRVVLQLGLTHEASFSVEPDMGTIVNGVQILVEAVCGISLFELTRAVIDEYIKNGKPPEGWESAAPSLEETTEEEPENESTSVGEPGLQQQDTRQEDTDGA